MQGRYKIAKQTSETAFYADVSLRVVRSSATSVTFSPDAFLWEKESYGESWVPPDLSGSFFLGAVAGAEYALRNAGSCEETNYKVVLEKVLHTTVDSTRETLAFAACFAVWAALDVVGENAPFLDGREIVFPAGL